MNKSKTITAIIKRHGAAFIGLTPEQRDALHNAMRAAWTAGNEARPDYNPPVMLDGDTSETIRKAQVFADAMPVPDDPHEARDWYYKVDAMLDGAYDVREMHEAVA